MRNSTYTYLRKDANAYMRKNSQCPSASQEKNEVCLKTQTLVCNLYPPVWHDYTIGRITAKHTNYRVVFDLFSMNCKNPRLTLCRKFNLVRH